MTSIARAEGLGEGQEDAIFSEPLENCSKGAFTAPCFGAIRALIPQDILWHLVLSGTACRGLGS